MIGASVVKFGVTKQDDVMLLDLLFLLLSLAIGFTIGVALLPWNKKMGGEGEFAFLRVFTLFWPFLLVDYFWHGARAYIKAWRRYLRSKSIEKSKK